MDPFEQKANKYIAEAEKKLNSWSLFTPKAQKMEDAAELYSQAANSYKTGGDWKKSGDTYLKAGDMYEKSSSHEAANCYVEAGKAYKKVSAKDACDSYTKAIMLYVDKNRHSTAARLSKEIGEMFEKDAKYEEALKAFERAAQFYLASDQPTNSNHQRLKVADLCVMVKEPDYKKAIKIYEQVARESLDTRMLRYSVKGYLFKAGLCSIAQAVHCSDTKGLADTIDKFKDLDPDFDGSLECKFLEDLIPLVDEGDEKKFEKTVSAFNRKKKIDDWTVDILLKVKGHLKKTVATDDLDIS